MSLPQNDAEHNCKTCDLTIAYCGRKRRQLEGHCLDWKPKASVGVET